MPKFLTIGYGDRNGYDRTPAALREAAHAHDRALRAEGALMGIAGASVQVRNPEAAGVETVSGPYLSSPLPVAGFAIIEAASLRAAIDLVSGAPCAVAHGVVEVWPLDRTPEEHTTPGAAGIQTEGVTDMEKTIAILIARLIFAAVFLMACGFKFVGMADTATYIAAAGFPAPLFLAWVAALFELGLALAFLTGAFFSEAALVAVAYVLFLAITFHGPSRWQDNQAEFGFFVDHFTFVAGLLFATVHGPGRTLVLRWRLLPRSGEAAPSWPWQRK